MEMELACRWIPLIWFTEMGRPVPWGWKQSLSRRDLGSYKLR